MRSLKGAAAQRYNHLDATRTRLLQGTEQGVSRRLYRFILATNLLYALSCWIFPLLFLLGPPDGRWGWHCLCFMQLVVARFLAILGNFLEEPGSLTTGQTVFIWVYGALSIAFPTLVAVAYFIYESQEHSCDEPPCEDPPLPWWLVMIVDYSWFVCLALTAKFLPAAPPLHFTVVVQEPEPEPEYELVSEGEPK